MEEAEAYLVDQESTVMLLNRHILDVLSEYSGPFTLPQPTPI